jgi:hypothetical protein
MITHRDPKSGEVTVTAREFSVLVSEETVRILVGGAVVHQWSANENRDNNEPSPRSRPAKRGSR